MTHDVVMFSVGFVVGTVFGVIAFYLITLENSGKK